MCHYKYLKLLKVYLYKVVNLITTTYNKIPEKYLHFQPAKATRAENRSFVILTPLKIVFSLSTHTDIRHR